MIFDRVVNFNIAAPKQYQIYQIVSAYNIRHAVTILVQGLGLVVIGKIVSTYHILNIVVYRYY